MGKIYFWLNFHFYVTNLNSEFLICEIMHSIGKYLQGLMGPAISKESFKSTKAIYHLTRLAMESLKIIDVNKIATTFLAKLPP